MKAVSKLLSLVLRHHPEKVGVQLDERGWVSVCALVEGFQKHGHPEFTLETLDEIVRTNDKKRFEYDVTATMIRACQGHSVNVDLGLTPAEPPIVLYHGTVGQNVKSIQEKGIVRGSRVHVHLSVDKETAVSVGLRRGRPVILTILAQAMHRAGLPFYRAANGVWLTDYVPAEYIEVRN